MESHKTSKRVSLPEGTFRIFAKSVRDVTSNKYKKDRSSSSSSSTDNSPDKDEKWSPKSRSPHLTDKQKDLCAISETKDSNKQTSVKEGGDLNLKTDLDNLGKQKKDISLACDVKDAKNMESLSDNATENRSAIEILTTDEKILRPELSEKHKTPDKSSLETRSPLKMTKTDHQNPEPKSKRKIFKEVCSEILVESKGLVVQIENEILVREYDKDENAAIKMGSVKGIEPNQDVKSGSDITCYTKHGSDSNHPTPDSTLKPNNDNSCQPPEGTRPLMPYNRSDSHLPNDDITYDTNNNANQNIGRKNDQCHYVGGRPFRVQRYKNSPNSRRATLSNYTRNKENKMSQEDWSMDLLDVQSATSKKFNEVLNNSDPIKKTHNLDLDAKENLTSSCPNLASGDSYMKDSIKFDSDISKSDPKIWQNSENSKFDSKFDVNANIETRLVNKDNKRLDIQDKPESLINNNVAIQAIDNETKLTALDDQESNLKTLTNDTQKFDLNMNRSKPQKENLDDLTSEYKNSPKLKTEFVKGTEISGVESSTHINSPERHPDTQDLSIQPKKGAETLIHQSTFASKKKDNSKENVSKGNYKASEDWTAELTDPSSMDQSGLRENFPPDHTSLSGPDSSTDRKTGQITEGLISNFELNKSNREKCFNNSDDASQIVDNLHNETNLHNEHIAKSETSLETNELVKLDQSEIFLTGTDHQSECLLDKTFDQSESLIVSTDQSEGLQVSTDQSESLQVSTDQSDSILGNQSKDVIDSHEDPPPDSFTNEPILSLQDDVPRLKPIYSRGGIRANHSSRGGHAFSVMEKKVPLNENDQIKPHPLMSLNLSGNWEKVWESEFENAVKEDEVFDNDLKIVPKENQPPPILNSQNQTDSCDKTLNDVVPGNVAPQFSQDIRRKTSVQDAEPKTNQNEHVSSGASIVEQKPSIRRHSAHVEQTRSKEQIRPSNLPPRLSSRQPRSRQDRELDERKMKILDEYLGEEKPHRRPSMRQDENLGEEKARRPSTRRNEYQGVEKQRRPSTRRDENLGEEKPHRRPGTRRNDTRRNSAGDKSNRITDWSDLKSRAESFMETANQSEDWSSELLEVKNSPVKREHFNERIFPASFSESISEANKSDSIPIPDNSMINVTQLHDGEKSGVTSPFKETHFQENMDVRSPNKKSPSRTCPQVGNTCNDQHKQSEQPKSGNRFSQDSDSSKEFNCDEDSSKEFSVVRDALATKHGFLTSSKMNSGIAISDAFSDFSSVGSEDDILTQGSKLPDTEKSKLPLQSTISMKNKNRYQYSSQDMSVTETISSMSTDPKCHVKNPKTLGDVDHRNKPPIPSVPPTPLNPMEYPYFPGNSPPFDPRVFNPFIPFYPYMYPPYYPGYDPTIREKHQKCEESRPVKTDELVDQQKGTDNGKPASPGKLKAESPSSLNPELCHLITVPLNKITDLEQAQLLLQYVEQLVKKVPNATGVYYQAVHEHGENSLEVGATTSLKTNNPPASEPSQPLNHQSMHSEEPKNDGSSQKHPHTNHTKPPDGCASKQPYIYKDISSIKPFYPRNDGSSTKPPQSYHHHNPQDLPEHCQNVHHGSRGLDEHMKASRDFVSHDYRYNYLNKGGRYMDIMGESESPNRSLVCYDLTTDDDDYYDDNQDGRKIVARQDNVDEPRIVVPHADRTIKQHSNYDKEFPELTQSFRRSQRTVSDKDITDRKVIDREGPQGAGDAAKDVMVTEPVNQEHKSSLRYVPPHKRRFSEYGECRPISSFGQFSKFEDENRNPYEIWQKYLKSTQSGPVPNHSNYVHNNWSEKLTDEPPIHPKFTNTGYPYPAPDEYRHRRGYSQGQIPDSLVNDARSYRPPYRQFNDNRRFGDLSSPSESLDSVASRSSYSSRLLNDNRLNNNAMENSIDGDIWKGRFKDRSKDYRVPFIDTHCHLDLLYQRLEFTGTYKQFLEAYKDCYPVNFEGCIAIFCFPRTYDLYKMFVDEEKVWITIGCHPKNSKQYNECVEESIIKIVQHPKCVALGEIGLDYSGIHNQYENLQKIVFRRQLEICVESKKPLVIHCRDAEDDCLEIMEQIIPKNYKIVCHCFSGDRNQANRWLSAFPNLYLGFTPVVTYKYAKNSQNAIASVPLNRLLLETDSPYFIPFGLQKEKQLVSFPGFALTVAEEVAKKRQISVVEVLQHCRHNTKTLFGI